MTLLKPDQCNNPGGGIDSGQIKLQLWDTAGEERFKALTPMYYRTAECILLAFSLTSEESFASLDTWI